MQNGPRVPMRPQSPIPDESPQTTTATVTRANRTLYVLFYSGVCFVGGVGELYYLETAPQPEIVPHRTPYGVQRK